MKTLLNIFFMAITIVCASAQIQPAHEWSATLKVVDDTGQPVSGAETCINYLTNRFTGLTDSNGIFTASHYDPSAQLAFRVFKTGYYPFQMQYYLGFRYDMAKWNSTTRITLGRIINPVPMYARRAQIEIPQTGKPIGFDLLEYDWTAPYGKGKQSDIVFQTHKRWTNRNDFDVTTKITFSNLGDGLIVATPQPAQSSTPHIFEPAPLDGYLPAVSRELSNTPSGGWKDNSKDQNSYLRIRTLYDGNGLIKSALYGKIYGDFTLDPINSKTTFILFTYYLNSKPNSRNVEFDTQQNLFKNLPDNEKETDP